MKEIKLETKRLILRKPKISDWSDIVEGIGEYDVAKMLVKVPYPYTGKDAKSFLKRKIKIWRGKDINDYVFMIELRSEKKVIGCIGLHEVDRFFGVATVGSWINKKYWRNGYMTETQIVLNNFAFNKLKLRRLNADVFTGNIASNATKIKLGYRLEGMQRKAKRSKATGKIYDINVYGLLKEDWQKTKPKLDKKI